MSDEVVAVVVCSVVSYCMEWWRRLELSLLAVVRGCCSGGGGGWSCRC